MASASRYTKTAVVLHWLIAFCIFGMFALGWYMTDLPKEAPKQMAYDLFDWGIYTWQLAAEATPRAFYFNLHKSLGVTIFALIIIRILWRITHRPPALLTSYKDFERKLANGTHHLLYLLMIALPVSGIIMASYSKHGLSWFGTPLIKGVDNHPMHEFFADAHETIGIIMLVMIGLHILGALKHKLIDKDGTLKRMSLH